MTLDEAFSTLDDGDYLKRKSSPFSLKRMVASFREAVQEAKSWATPPAYWVEDLAADDWEKVD